MMIPNLYIEKNGWLEITISIHENKRVVFWDSRIGFGGLISGPNLREFSVHVSSETMPSVITSARGPRLRPLLAQSTIFFLRVAHQGSLWEITDISFLGMETLHIYGKKLILVDFPYNKCIVWVGFISWPLRGLMPNIFWLKSLNPSAPT